MGDVMKHRISHLAFVLVVSFFFASFQNWALWQHLTTILAQADNLSWGFLLSIPLLITALCVALFTLLLWPVVYKPLAAVLIVLSTLATYAMVNYGQYFNYGMIVNIFETNQSEAASYLSPSVLLWFGALALLPLVWLVAVKVRFPSSAIRLIGQKLAMLLAVVVVVGAVAGLYYKDYASLVRNHSEIKALINPTNYLSASFRYAKYRLYEQNLPFKVLGTDARDTHTMAIAEGGKPDVVVLVVGETSRAMNYSLNGYPRQTNPRLSQEDVVSFRHVASCGTATAVSLPCMFSDMTHDSYNATAARHEEGVLDILKHAGVDISWKDNDGGCKGVCDRVEHMEISPKSDPTLCHDGTCYDAVLLDGLAEKIANAKQDTLIVLHLIGSHGPTYYRRYPEQFKVFTPTCDTSEIQDCSREALLNTYDNTIVYTDYVLSQVVALLKQNDTEHETAMLYLSDHGESLGEDGVYLHGLPYGIAPREQKRVPLILWLSPAYQQSHGIDRQCLQAKAQQDKVSQDNLFHTLLGMMAVQTHVYQPGLDILASCETGE
ncbi:phosphoethanolamine transferase EptA [Photobacterium aquae]|nr:phosphoethanolamine transferase EptA [Photobacterium aquae]